MELIEGCRKLAIPENDRGLVVIVTHLGIACGREGDDTEFAQCQSLRRSKSASCRFAGDRSIRLQVSAFTGVERLNEIVQPLKTIRSFCVADSSNFAIVPAFENKTADMCRASACP